MKQLISFVSDFLPLRMWKCVVTMLICGVVMLIEMLTYEKVVWGGPAQIVASDIDDGRVRFTMKSVDGSYEKPFHVIDANVTLDHIQHGTMVFQCAVSELSSADCTVPKAAK